MKPSIVLLTFNSAASIGNTLQSVAGLSDDIHIVDSGSQDETLAIAQAHGAKIHHHPFISYGAQRNWAIDTLPLAHPWQLHLDADEALTPELRAEILALPEAPPLDGYFVARYLRWMNKVLRHNLAPTWHMRLFRSGAGRCEDRHYDQHFICTGATAQLRGSMIDDIQMSLSEWTFRHNRWADAEVHELIAKVEEGRVQASATGNIVQRKRFYRGFYERAPLFVRSIALFFYRYFFKFGFLDGTEGLIFCVLQTLWFRFLVDAKLYESRKLPPSQ
jgi:glycosyltransferase involved in cell wall biosynthesis